MPRFDYKAFVTSRRDEHDLSHHTLRAKTFFTSNPIYVSWPTLTAPVWAVANIKLPMVYSLRVYPELLCGDSNCIFCKTP